ncbi:MAG: hypothetical protein QGI83_23590 [Candidatus Latescibacteria bacterium]|nr:hypothetical protein [Candidatus Latescibacterota bacterium]
MSDGLHAGAAVSNVTPWLGLAIPGYFQERYGNDVHDELLAKALVFDNGDTRVAMVTCDFICMPEKLASAVKSRVQERCGIPPDHTMVNATHTHTGVAVMGTRGVEEETEYTDYAALKIADAVELAVRRLRPARVGFALVQEGRIAFCRRWRMKDGTVRMNPGIDNPDLVAPVSPIDPDLAIMYVEGTDGAPISAVANFSLHYVGASPAETLSADYYGHFHRLMRHYIGGDCVPVLWNAASGQINNIDYSGRTRWKYRGHAQAARMANVLAGHVITEIQLMDMHESLELGGAADTFEFLRKPVTEDDLALANKVLAATEEPIEDYDSGPFSWVVGHPIPKERVYAYAEECLRLNALPERMTAPVQALKLGDAAVVGLPGEIFVEIAMNVKAQASADPVFVQSLANGHLGYVATDKAFKEEGGYETWASMSAYAGPGTAPAMEATAVSLLSDLGLAST